MRGNLPPPLQEGQKFKGGLTEKKDPQILHKGLGHSTGKGHPRIIRPLLS